MSITDEINKFLSPFQSSKSIGPHISLPMSSTFSSLLLILQLCLAVYACVARPIGNNENVPGKSFQVSSIKNKEKSSAAEVYIVSNPIPRWAPAKIGTSLLKNEKNEDKSRPAGVYIGSNPIPRWAPAKSGSSLLKNDNAKDDIQWTSAKDHLDDEKHEEKFDQTSEIDDADHDDDTTEFPVSRSFLYDVDYAPARTRPPQHN